MRNHWLHTALLFVLVGAALPTLADEVESDEPVPEEDTFIGQWYVQFMDERVTPLDEPLRLVFEKTGRVRVFEGDDEEEAMAYTFDEAQATITIVEQDDPTDIEAIIKYSFVDDMLVMKIREGRGDGDDEEIIELTRKPEGTKRHQKMRKEAGDQPSKRKQMQRMVDLRQLYMGAMLYHADHNVMPADLGDIVVGGYLEAERAIPAAMRKELPKDFEGWKKPAKRDWINQHTGCVFLQVDLEADKPEEQIAIFDLPTSKDQDTITLIFADGHGEMMARKEADPTIKKQTGHTLDEWLKTTSPGTGKMVLPKKQAEEPAENE